MGRVLAIDYGDQRTGLALSDLTGLLTGEAITVQEWNAERLADRVVEYALSHDTETLVLGLPKNMDGTEGSRAEKARAFGEMLRARCSLPLVFWDERRSSIEAHNILHSVGKKEKKHRATVDAVAASLLLEGYLDSQRMK